MEKFVVPKMFSPSAPKTVKPPQFKPAAFHSLKEPTENAQQAANVKQQRIYRKLGSIDV